MKLSKRKRCPQCAELVRQEAVVCRYCAAHLSIEREDDQPSHARNWVLPGFLVFGVVASVAAGVWTVGVRPKASPQSTSTPIPKLSVPSAQNPTSNPALAAGETIEWKSVDAPVDLRRQIGPLEIAISKQSEDELFAPKIDVAFGTQRVELTGPATISSSLHYISAVSLQSGDPPAVILRSFSGGAHCCTVVKIATVVGGTLKAIDLGEWDGDGFNLPNDLSGDGVADFVVSDDRFLYSFAPYAMSASMPKVLNVVGGRVVDVSKRKPFRFLFKKTMNESASACKSAPSGMERNGACPAYVASAAMTGGLSRAWQDMMVAYDASVEWELPTGCLQPSVDNCAEAAKIYFKSYPEALLFFLKKGGYIDSRWIPPETFGNSGASDNDGQDEKPLLGT